MPMRLLLLACLALCLCAGESRIYFIGNSVTDTVQYGALSQLGASGGIAVTWGRHMIPGAPLEWLWKNQDSGFNEAPFGTSRKAVAEFAWDHITLQPFDRLLEHDAAVITTVIDLQTPRNPACRFWIYQRWPRMVAKDSGKALDFDKLDYDPARGHLSVDLSGIKPWHELYSRAYTNGWDGSNEGREFFLALLAEARARRAQAELRLIPVGDVIAELDARLRSGAVRVDGWDSAWRLYKDSIHLGSTGSWLVGATFAATLWGLDPATLPTDGYGAVDTAIAPAIRACIADVLARTPDAKP